jgi:hypothetical protein
MGLARSQGWQLRYDTLVRRIGNYRLELCVPGIFPKAVGEHSCSNFQLFRQVERTPLDHSQEDPIGVSECLRAADLLFSVSAFGLSDSAYEPHTARARRVALLGMLGDDPSRGGAHVEGRYVRRGDLMIHIATGRASRNGAELALPSDQGAPCSIPYPDLILRRIVAHLNAHHC